MKVSYSCYIEEYNNGQNARLRDKATNSKIAFISEDENDKKALLQFMSAIKSGNFDAFSPNSSDSILVEGNLISKNENEIQITYDDDLTYIIE